MCKEDKEGNTQPTHIICDIFTNICSTPCVQVKSCIQDPFQSGRCGEMRGPQVHQAMLARLCSEAKAAEFGEWEKIAPVR